MTHQQLQDAILDCTPPGIWKQAVQEKQHVFTEKELMFIAYQYTETFADRLKALDLLRQYASLHTAAFAKDISTILRTELMMFKFPESGCYYELCVKTTSHDWDETFACTTFEAALRIIPYYHKMYVGEESVCQYIIRKRRIVDDAFLTKALCPSDSDCLEDETEKKWECIDPGYCIFSPGKFFGLSEPVLLTAHLDTYLYDLNKDPENCDHVNAEHCQKCKIQCVEGEMVFPDFLKPGDIVQYRDVPGATDYSERKSVKSYYGIIMSWKPLDEKPIHTDFYTIVRLSTDLAEYMQNHSIDELVRYDHIPCPNIEKIMTIHELPKCLQESCRTFLDAYEQYTKMKK